MGQLLPLPTPNPLRGEANHPSPPQYRWSPNAREPIPRGLGPQGQTLEDPRDAKEGGNIRNDADVAPLACLNYKL